MPSIFGRPSKPPAAYIALANGIRRGQTFRKSAKTEVLSKNLDQSSLLKLSEAGCFIDLAGSCFAIHKFFKNTPLIAI